MGKKLLSVLLALSLLAGALSCGVLLSGSAEVPQPDKVQRTSYVVQAFEDTTYAAYAGQVMAQPNVAAAASRKLYDDVAKFGTTSTAGSVTDTKGTMMDGVIPGVYGTHDEADSNAYKGHYSAAYYLFLDFGGTASVEQIMLAGPALTTMERNTKLGTVTVWLGDDPATLTTAPTATYTETVNVAALITPTAPVSARYAAVKITGGADWSRFAELGFYSSAPAKAQKDGYTMATFADPVYKSFAAGIMARPNVLKGVTPAAYGDATLSGSTGTINNSASYATDGNIPGLTDDGTSGNYKIHWNSATSPYLLYDLAGTASVDQLLLAGCYLDYTGRWEIKFGSVKIYMGNDRDTLITEENLVIDATFDMAALFTLEEAVECRYIALHFVDSYARVSELGVYTKDDAPVVVPPVINDKGTYVEATIDKPAQVHAFTEALARKNVIDGVVPTVYNAATLTGSTGTINNSASYATDGNIPGLTDNGTSGNYKIHWNSDTSPYLLYDLAGTGSIDQLLLAGCYLDYTGRWTIKFGSVKIYMGNDKDTLIAAENLVIDATFDVAALFTFKEAVECRYIALHFVDSYARVSELGVYGTVAPGIDKGDYVVRTFTDTADAEFVKGIMENTNVIDAHIPKVYANPEAFVTSTGAAIQDNNTAMTDKTVPGITEVDPEGYNNSNVYKGHWNSKTSPWLYYDLVGKGDIKYILLAGSWPERMALGTVRIYMGNDLASLTTAECLIAEEDVNYCSVLTIKDVKKYRYIAVQFLASYARVSELGFYSETGYPKIEAPNGKEFLSTPINTPDDAHKIPTDDNWLKLASTYAATLHKEVPLKESSDAPQIAGSTEMVVADGDVPGINSENDSQTNKAYWSIEERGDYMLFDMTAPCRQIDRILLAGSYHEYNGQYRMSLGDVKVYLGNDMNTLIQDENCYAVANITVGGLITLSEPVDAQYIAIWFGGHSGYVRLSEVGIYCDYEAPGANAPITFTGTCDMGPITVKTQRTFNDLYDPSFLNSIAGVRLVKKEYPTDAPAYIDNGLLRPAEKAMYSLELYDANGNTVTTKEPHILLATVPNLNDSVNTMAVYDNGTVTRPWDIQPSVDRKTLLVGNDFGEKGTLYYTEPINLIYFTYNTTDEVREATGQPAYPHFSLNFDNGKPVITY